MTGASNPELSAHGCLPVKRSSWSSCHSMGTSPLIPEGTPPGGGTGAPATQLSWVTQKFLMICLGLEPTSKNPQHLICWSLGEGERRQDGGSGVQCPTPRAAGSHQGAVSRWGLTTWGQERRISRQPQLSINMGGAWVCTCLSRASPLHPASHPNSSPATS